MAASTVAVASAGCAVSAPVQNSSTLSSRSAFGSSLVQFAPVRRSLGNANRVVVVRANLSEEQSTSGKKVLASFLAASAALSLAGQALASNPVDVAKNTADQVVSSAQSATSNLPKLPKIELPNGSVFQDAEKAAEGAVKDVQGRMDGIFGQNKPYKGRVASTNGGTGSAIGDAKKRIANFGKNPFAENLEKTTEEFNASIGTATGENSGSARAARELLGQDSTRVDAATQKINDLGDDFKTKAKDALGEAKGFVGSAQNAAPDLPSIPTPELPSVPNPLEGLNKNVQDIKGKAESVKGDFASKTSAVKGDVASKASSAINGKASDAVDGVKSFVGSAKNDVASNVSSKVDDVKGDVASKASSITNSTPNDVADGAKNLVGSAQDATSNFPSLPNPFEGISKSLQGKADDVKDAVASKADDVKGEVSSKASSFSNSTPGDAVDGAKNLVGSAQSATSNLPSLPNPFDGKDVNGKAVDVKNDVASKAEQVKGDVSSKASSTMNKNAGDVLDEAKTFVGSAAKDSTPSFPNLPNPFDGFNSNVKNLQDKASDLKENGASTAEDVKGDVAAKASKVLQ
ncbi:hypothetical protein Mapa_003064 [Marchantia paleacea]|nr:hypothetical protein Mapa_003064 [Marchantia paleacea]